MSQVLIVDDEPAICWSLSELLRDRGYTVEAVSSVEQARGRLETFAADVIVLDVRLPGEDGLSALAAFRQQRSSAAIIVITAFGDLGTAVTALGRGAFDYLVKPFDLNHFADVVARALIPRESMMSRGGEVADDQPLVGRSSAMQGIFRQIAIVAPTEFPVLLLGETGTGKEVAARAIHQHSARGQEPFVPVCLAALSPALVESELFGHVRGAFTGAVEDRPGLFDLAARGTIFLDEIAETPLAVQVKLLRVLETRKFSPVGSVSERTTAARVVAATHRHLDEMITRNEFREDLYHRLKVFTVALPPLRERFEDVRPLVESFLEKYHGTTFRPSLVSEEFWAALTTRDWPGNVRELRHAIDHAVVFARGGPLLPEHLPSRKATSATPLEPGNELRQATTDWVRAQLRNPGPDLREELLRLVDSVLLREVLEATQQNRTAAAKLLGLDRATLRGRMRQLFGEEAGV